MKALRTTRALLFTLAVIMIAFIASSFYPINFIIRADNTMLLSALWFSVALVMAAILATVFRLFVCSFYFVNGQKLVKNTLIGVIMLYFFITSFCTLLNTAVFSSTYRIDGQINIKSNDIYKRCGYSKLPDNDIFTNYQKTDRGLIVQCPMAPYIGGQFYKTIRR